MRQRLVLGSAFLLVGAALLKKIADYDIWYHLVVGREIARSWHLPAREFYVYTMLGSPAGFHEYGFDLLFFAVHSLFGERGMSVFNAAIGATTLIVICLAARIRRDGPFLEVLLLAPLLWIVEYRLVYRAEAFLYLALAVEIYLLERHAVESRLRWLLPLPAVAILLTNIHPSCVILLIVMAAYYAQALVDHARALRDIPSLSVGFAAVLVATALASAVNSYGFTQLLLPLQFAGQTRLLSATAEFAPTLGTPHGPILIGLCMAGILALVVRRERRVVDGLVLLFFAILAFRHVRNVALFALASYVPVTRGLEDLRMRIPGLTTRVARVLGAACALGVLGLSAALAARAPVWGAGVVPGMFPEKAATLIATRKPAGRLFNYPHLGGYLAWRLYDDYLVAADGRRYYGWDRSLEIADAVFGAREGYEGILQDYGVTMIATPGIVQVEGSLVPLVPILDRDDGWALVSSEPADLLFMRSEVARSAGIEPLSKDQVWLSVGQDASRILESVPNPTPGVYLSMGYALLELGRVDESEAWLSRYVAASPADEPAGQLLRLIREARMGDRSAQAGLDAMLGRNDREAEREPR